MNKEIVEIMKRMIEDGNLSKEVAVKYCPELKESEDERIIKRLVVMTKGCLSLEDEEQEEILAWLEKHGEQKPADKVEPKFKVGDKVKMKKFESFPHICTVENIDSDVYYCDYTNFDIKDQDNWEFIEQKTADKVEPKFHEGDWLCESEPNNYARFIQILEIINVQGKKRYRISRDIHNDEDKVDFDFVEKYYHKFGIQDAKPGDVLFIGIDASTCIFKKLEGNLLYSYIISDGKLLVENSHYYYETDDNVYPATKEQRNTLVQKMKEAGYEWDDKKLELKKVEQKSAWSEEDENTLKEIITDVKFEGYNNDMQANSYKKINWLKSLKDRVQPQNTWKPSEEQIKALEWQVENTSNTSWQYEHTKELLEQLKSLTLWHSI